MAMPKGRPKGKWRNTPQVCAVCTHPQRGQIDYLLVTSDGRHGTGRRLLAERFGIGAYSIYRHNQHHISAEYRAAVVAGPFGSETELRELAAGGRQRSAELPCGVQWPSGALVARA
jgi:hypothetical protein